MKNTGRWKKAKWKPQRIILTEGGSKQALCGSTFQLPLTPLTLSIGGKNIRESMDKWVYAKYNIKGAQKSI